MWNYIQGKTISWGTNRSSGPITFLPLWNSATFPLYNRTSLIIIIFHPTTYIYELILPPRQMGWVFFYPVIHKILLHMTKHCERHKALRWKWRCGSMTLNDDWYSTLFFYIPLLYFLYSTLFLYSTFIFFIFHLDFIFHFYIFYISPCF